jgi:hypothetical protein
MATGTLKKELGISKNVLHNYIIWKVAILMQYIRQAVPLNQ